MRPVSTTSLLNRKEQASSANTPILHPPKKAKAIFSAGKILTAVFWDSKGIIYPDFLTGQKTINAQYYSTLLNKKMKSAIHSKRRKMQDPVCFLQDNAPPHTVALMMATPLKLQRDVLPHPLYSPDLSPSDYHFLGPMKRVLGGKRFRIIDEVIAAVKFGYTSSRKPSLKLESRSFQNVDTSVWQSTGTTLESSVYDVSILL
jgi:histone-lysine N-methyltransferase SETMAR